MKQGFLVLLQRILARSLRTLRYLELKQRRSISALVLPPADSGNLGDEAMLTAVVGYLRGIGIARIGLISHGPSQRQRFANSELDIIDMEPYFISHSRKHIVGFLWKVGREYDQFYCLGADMMDGFYSDVYTNLLIDLTSWAAQTGAKTTILGFSFNANPALSSETALRNLPSTVRLCARDQLSANRLNERLGRSIELVSDVAFLLSPTHDTCESQQVLEWIHVQHSRKHVVLGINANTLHVPASSGEGEFEGLVDAYVDVASELAAKIQGLSLVFLPHDSRGNRSDVLIARSIHERLPEQLRNNSLVIPESLSAEEVKSVCGTLDFVLSGRMHVAIASLGQGTPVACITYQDKFEGLFQHFGLTGMTISPEDAFKNGKLASFLWPLVCQRDQIRQEILGKLPSVCHLARLNFEVIK